MRGFMSTLDGMIPDFSKPFQTGGSEPDPQEKRIKELEAENAAMRQAILDDQDRWQKERDAQSDILRELRSDLEFWRKMYQDSDNIFWQQLSKLCNALDIEYGKESFESTIALAGTLRARVAELEAEVKTLTNALEMCDTQYFSEEWHAFLESRKDTKTFDGEGIA